jgi:hypothetical protein
VIAAILSYEVDTLQYIIANVPANFIRLTIIESMLPYVVSAVFSFIIAFMAARASSSADEKVFENQSATQPKQEADLEKAAQKEMETA